ncbi:MAG: DUF1028 domain-containing protein [Chloroflexi bacterium]|nr:DUF1028 domain-containing protein [Chloroflexota bacterium]
MTYTVIACDSANGQLGIGIATYSLAVGASCPYIRPGVAAVSTQAATFPAHGPALLEMLANGSTLDDAFERLCASDPDFEYRQVGVVTSDCDTHVHTGTKTRNWAGSLTGENWLVMGNVLAGEQVAAQMAAALNKDVNAPLATKLLAALEAGRDSGGQVGLNAMRLPERSAVVLVYGSEPFPVMDLRVDDHPDAVTELRRIFDRFSRADGYYRDRAERPASTQPQDRWMAEHGMS